MRWEPRVKGNRQDTPDWNIASGGRLLVAHAGDCIGDDPEMPTLVCIGLLWKKEKRVGWLRDLTAKKGLVPDSPNLHQKLA